MEHNPPYLRLDSSASSLKKAGNRGRRAFSLSAASSKTRRFAAVRGEQALHMGFVGEDAAGCDECVVVWMGLGWLEKVGG
jgi:hypothetical protein